MGVLDIVQWVTASAGWACLLLRLVPVWRTAGWFAVANGAVVLADVLHGNRLADALVSAAICALNAWIWWNGGGGDGMRPLRSAFRGVRRTAPVAGGAS